MADSKAPRPSNATPSGSEEAFLQNIKNVETVEGTHTLEDGTVLYTKTWKVRCLLSVVLCPLSILLHSSSSLFFPHFFYFIFLLFFVFLIFPVIYFTLFLSFSRFPAISFLSFSHL
ncbi:hypothetical protein L228DRAFT_60291 [Xylona heveae TC161]|uniref:Uncharacterized protein n=1 Tax=Xylona heveae (strain CBS 132557 / TC161) TaxID=1328760 RepID=A0A165IKF1_XYLHT|nr:hypothetical protein L228DRAFT_60291 [Xylona heveae TC161]KZF25022.1 hypothetical protein L228DRAFT_60291 [Xylona heveae TC161]